MNVLKWVVFVLIVLVLILTTRHPDGFGEWALTFFAGSGIMTWLNLFFEGM